MSVHVATPQAAPAARFSSPTQSARPLRILVLHQHYWPEIAATAQLLTDLCEDLAAQRHEVRVMCGPPSYRRQEGDPALAEHEVRRGVHIHRVWSYVPSER